MRLSFLLLFHLLLLTNQAWAQDSRDQMEQRLRTLHRAAQSSGSPSESCQLLLEMGRLHQRLGRLETALHLRGRALDVARVSGSSGLVAECLFAAATSDLSLGKLNRAQDRWQQSLRLYRELEEPWGQSQVLMELGSLFFRAGRSERASLYYEAANSALAQLPSSPRVRQARARLMFNRANLELKGNPKVALSLYRSAYNEVKSPDLKLNLGSALLEAGQPESALTLWQEAQAAYREQGDTEGQVRAGLNLAALHHRLGAGGRSLDILNELLDGLPLETQLPSHLQARLALNLSRLVSSPQEKARWLEQARTRLGAEDVTELTFAVVEQQIQSGQLGAARESLESLSNSNSGPTRRALALGQLALLEKDSKAAKHWYGKVLKETQMVSHPHLEWRAHLGLARAQESPLMARSHYLRALEALDEVGGRLRSDELRTTFLEDKHPLYSELIELLIELGEPEAAFEVSERGRARSLLESLRQASLLSTPKSSRGLLEIQARLPENATLLSYWLGKDKTWLFVVKKTSFRCLNLELSPTQLQAEVESLRPADWFDGRQTPRFDQAAATRLHFALLGRLELIKGEKLLIVPDGPLYSLPFALLKSRDFLLVEHPIVYAQSASLFVTPREPRRPPKSISVYAAPKSMPEPPAFLGGQPPFPPLPFSALEAEAVAKHFERKRVRLGVENRESQFYRDQSSEQSSVLHFATHCFVNHRNPLYSGLVLSSESFPHDGLLLAKEIAEIPLPAQLVVLSACNSGVGRQAGGEGVLGLARAFQLAGARNVMASLWQVSDRSTAELMTAFYDGLAEGLDLSEALRQAQLKELAKTNTHPYLWAPFVIFGADR